VRSHASRVSFAACRAPRPGFSNWHGDSMVRGRSARVGIRNEESHLKPHPFAMSHALVITALFPSPATLVAQGLTWGLGHWVDKPVGLGSGSCGWEL